MALDSIRKELRILEPHQTIDPNLTLMASDDNAQLDQRTQIAQFRSRLFSCRRITDPKVLEVEMRQVLANKGLALKSEDLLIAMREMLFLSARVGQSKFERRTRHPVAHRDRLEPGGGQCVVLPR